MVDYWIQIENRPWDLSPHDIDRMTGRTMKEATGFDKAMVSLTSVVPGTLPRTVMMSNPLRDGKAVIDALILRRYRAPAAADGSDAWTVPDDRKINPWDLNEHNPGETGTMGTIPGPVIECQVGDSVRVHFRNADGRADKDVLARTHSLHPHGFVFAPPIVRGGEFRPAPRTTRSRSSTADAAVLPQKPALAPVSLPTVWLVHGLPAPSMASCRAADIGYGTPLLSDGGGAGGRVGVGVGLSGCSGQPYAFE